MNVEAQKRLRPLNQWKFFLQKNLNNIAIDCLAADSDRNNALDHKEFMRVIERRGKFPEYLKQQNGEMLQEFIGDYTEAETGKVDYRGLIEELRYFDYEDANNKSSMSRKAPIDEPKHAKKETPKRRTIFEDDYVVLDSQKVPVNILDQIECRLARVGRLIKRTFGNEQSLGKALREATTVHDKNGNISVDDLKSFVLNSCKDQIIHRSISKKDVEAFLSAFIYNAYGATNVESVSKLIFTNENYVAKQLSRKIRANPPPDEVNADLEQAEYYATETADVAKSTTGFSAIDFKKAGTVLKEIEEKVFFGGLPRTGTYQSVFKTIFDVDGDGFVSHADFEGACRKLQIKSDYHSVLHAIRALDTENKGYFDYREFSKKISPGVGERLAAMNGTGEFS